MQFSESWLRTWCNPTHLNTEQLAHALTMGGLEVESQSLACPSFSGVVVAKITGIEKHPDADRLRICQVDTGQEACLQIVCGAPNARVGILVPCALVGAQLPPTQAAPHTPFLIQLSKVRGETSQGMLCSSSELRLLTEQTYDGLLELPADASIGQNIRHFLNLDDTLLTLKLTPNLAHCLGIQGVARELSALTGSPLLMDLPSILHSFPHSSLSTSLRVQSNQCNQQHEKTVKIDVQAPDLCGRFAGRLIENIDASVPTPAWMLDRLARCGQRSINVLVDISNYVMFELGRPSHFFDADKLQGGLTIRWGNSEESVLLLNGKTVTVDAKIGVIADENGVQAIAGIMGGEYTSVSTTTSKVYLEVAFWKPKAIAGRARRFHFSTDASHRFERGVDAESVVEHLSYITDLVVAICGTKATQVGKVDDIKSDMPVQKKVVLRVERAEKVIGMPLTLVQCEHAFERLNLPFSSSTLPNGSAIIEVTPPSYRFDLQIEEDLIEEVIRMVGFEQLPHTPPKGTLCAKTNTPNEDTRNPHTVRRQLAEIGYQESIHFGFITQQWELELHGNTPNNLIELANPIASNLSVMRSSLLGSLLHALKMNIDKKSDKIEGIRLFEIGRVFQRNDQIQDTCTTVKGFHQPMHVAGVAFGRLQPLQWGNSTSTNGQGNDICTDFFDVKGDVEQLLCMQTGQWQSKNIAFRAPLPSEAASIHPFFHPGRMAMVYQNDTWIGHVGELHPQWVQNYGLSKNGQLKHAPIFFELDLLAVLQSGATSLTTSEPETQQFKPLPKQQSIQRDLAIWLDDTITCEELMACIGLHASNSKAEFSVEMPGFPVLFDVYHPDAATGSTSMLQRTQKSMALRFSFHAKSTTDGTPIKWEENAIASFTDAILLGLSTDLGARLRI